MEERDGLTVCCPEFSFALWGLVAFEVSEGEMLVTVVGRGKVFEVEGRE